MTSKDKGNKFENMIYDDIRKLGYWIRKNKGSGNADDNKGDLETYNLLIECKHHRKVSPLQITRWMQKIVLEATFVKKYPLLIIKENYKPIKVYYVTLDGTIGYMDYRLWRDTALKTEKEFISTPQLLDTNIKPTYIG